MLFKKKPYKIKTTGRGGIVYEEGDRVMKIGSEMLSGEFDYVVYTETMDAWEPPHDSEPVSDADRERIRSNIAEELKYWKIDWEYRGGRD